MHDLIELHKDDRFLYLPREGGGFYFHPQLRADVERLDAELEVYTARLQAEAVERREAWKLAERDKLGAHQVHQAFVAHGINVHLAKGAAALFAEQMVRVVDPTKTGPEAVMVQTDYGPAELAFAVESWLLSEEGEVFRPRQKFGHPPGPLSLAMRAATAKH